MLLEVHFVFDFSNEIVFVFKQYWKMIKYVLKTYVMVLLMCNEVYSVLWAHFIEPTCAIAWWAHMRHFPSVT